MKRFACVLLAAGFGCGVQSNPINPNESAPPGPLGGVPLASMAPSGANIAKVVLKTTTTTLQVLGDFEGVLTCTANSDCGGGAAFCDLTPGSPTFDDCLAPVATTAVFYLQAADPLNDSSQFKVPCDNRSYAVEVYFASKGSTNEVNILAVYTGSVQLDGTCTLASNPVWTATPASGFPSLTAPPVYVGLGAPYDKYTLRYWNPGYPWASGLNGLMCSGQTPLTGTTFKAPATAARVDCGASAYLDKSILTSTDYIWDFIVIASFDPIATGGINFPP